MPQRIGTRTEKNAHQYTWQRYWVRRDTIVYLTQRGYLPDPQSDYAPWDSAPFVPLSSLEATPCLALLGEPGMGKTSALASERERIDEQITSNGDSALWIRLRQYDSGQWLVNDIFSSSELNRWLAGTQTLYVFLDDFDECHLRVETLAALLVDQLGRLPINAIRERLRLRIACRTAAWPQALEDDLRKLWGNQHVVPYELLPLREVDVVEAAQARSLPTELFLQAIDLADAAPLANRPITLGFLLDLYENKGTFPSHRVELYAEGCELLCRELNPDRIAAGRTGDLSPAERLATAGRLAAASMFTGLFEIANGLGNRASPGVLAAEDILPAIEQVGLDTLKLSLAAVRETVQTALFSGRTADTVGWAHQTFAEFLAARYLVTHDMPTTQVLSLILFNGDDRRVAPQMREIAAWLASLSPEIFKVLIESEPEVLLLSDVLSLTDSQRAELVEFLLHAHEQERVSLARLGFALRFDRLKHSGLHAQLLPWIVDKTKPLLVRRTALSIAEACALQSMQSEFARIALDSTEEMNLRKDAARSVARHGDPHSRAMLVPLVMVSSSDDPDGELKGASLAATWPEHLKASQLFASLSMPPIEVFGGTFWRFASSDWTDHITPTELPVALDWAASQASKENRPPMLFRELAQRILRLGWEQFDVPEVERAFTKAALARIMADLEIFDDRHADPDRTPLEDEGKRRRLNIALLKVMREPRPNHLWRLLEFGITSRTDVSWLAARLSRERNRFLANRIAMLIEWLFDAGDPAHVSEVWDLRAPELVLGELGVQQGHPALRYGELLSYWLDPVVMNGPVAEQLKREYTAHDERQQRQLQRWERMAEKDQAKLTQMQHALSQVEAGQIHAWWDIPPILPDEHDWRVSTEQSDSETSVPEKWQAIDQASQARIVAAAEQYVRGDNPYLEMAGRRVLLEGPAIAGTQAFQLLRRVAPDRLATLTTADWRRWAEALTHFCFRFDSDDTTTRAFKVTAYQHAPDEIISTTLQLIDARNTERFGVSLVVASVSDLWDTRLEAALKAKATDPSLTAESFGALLDALLDHESDGAENLALEALELWDASPAQNERAVEAVRSLITHGCTSAWDLIWQSLTGDRNFGRQVFLRVVTAARHGEPTLTGLSEQALADLYLWLAQEFPHADDRFPLGAHTPAPRHLVAHWRDALLAQLQNRGTLESVASVRRILGERPDLTWLTRVLAEAEEQTRRAIWSWPTPSQVLALVADPERRYVETHEQLLDVIIESLLRLERRLQSQESRAVADLWNLVDPSMVRGIAQQVLANLRMQFGRGTNQLLTIDGYWDAFREQTQPVHRPKEEILLSDYVKRHLDDDLIGRGIIVNREVQNRPRDINDIQVQAIVHESDDTTASELTVIVEVKGCWNPDLDEAMQGQLVERYLQPDRLRHGLFLVGWFAGRQCGPGASKREPWSLSLEQARAYFDDQARALSTDGWQVRAMVLDTSL